jgi:hypothetical protein
MTTPPTPAGWYPDPEDSAGLRYFDGMAWTEHRTPAAPPSQPPPFEPEREQFGEGGGAHRAPDSEPESEQVPITEQPTTKVPLREPAPYADATTPTPAEPAVVEPPIGTEPPATVDNRNLIVWFAGAVAALLLALVLVAVYAFVIRDDGSVDLSSPDSTETSQSTVTETETTTTETSPVEASTPPPAAGAVDGPLEFTVTGVESGPTVSDPTNEFLTKDAQGEFIVVRLTVRNTSPDPATFLGTFQKLNAAGTVYSIDDEASFYVGGGYAEIPPGGQVDVGVAYDVPPGTVPETIDLHADPISPGVQLPVGG